MTKSTAILLFSRTAAAEGRAKAFGPTDRVAKSLIRRTEHKLARTGLPVLRSDETNQQGHSFGERLANAVQRVFDRGYTRVIVVGNDCTSVQTSHLRSAAQKMKSGKHVLGPDHRGGAWLIGLQRDDFDANRFKNLSWETTTLYGELEQLLPRVTGLTRLHDVNELGDLRRLWSQLRSFFGDLFDLLFTRASLSSGTKIAPAFSMLMRPDSRGPPTRRHGL